MSEEEKVMVLFKECFDDNRVKLCGRDKCIDLIMALEDLFPGVNFGNNRTGYMNIDNVVKYVDLLKCNNLKIA